MFLLLLRSGILLDQPIGKAELFLLKWMLLNHWGIVLSFATCTLLFLCLYQTFFGLRLCRLLRFRVGTILVFCLLVYLNASVNYYVCKEIIKLGWLFNLGTICVLLVHVLLVLSWSRKVELWHDAAARVLHCLPRFLLSHSRLHLLFPDLLLLPDSG